MPTPCFLAKFISYYSSMKYKDFSPQLYKSIETTIHQVKNTQQNPCVAFDADGTLWDLDLGEEFFKYQIEKSLVPFPKDPWDYYHQLKLKNNNPREAYLWLAQINANVPLQTVRLWAQQAVENLTPLPIFESQKSIISLFQKADIEVFVVTAPVKWAVEPGAALLGIPPENVIGVQTKTSSNGIITNEQNGPMTYREGKVEGLLHFNQNRTPFFCSGNTMGDWELLNKASHLQLAVSGCTEVESVLFKTEMDLQMKAQEKGWQTHRFA